MVAAGIPDKGRSVSMAVRQEEFWDIETIERKKAKRFRTMKLKPSILDYLLFRNKRFDQVISLRKEIESMVTLWEKLPITTRMKYPDVSTGILMGFQMMTFDEVSYCRDQGLSAVVERLQKDRKKVHELLSQVPEMNLSGVTSEARLRRLAELGI